MPEAMVYPASWEIMSTLRRSTFRSSVVCVCSSLLLLLRGLRPTALQAAEVTQLLKFTSPTRRAVCSSLEPTYRLPRAFGIPVLERPASRSLRFTGSQTAQRSPALKQNSRTEWNCWCLRNNTWAWHLSSTWMYSFECTHAHTLTYSLKTKTLWKY